MKEDMFENLQKDMIGMQRDLRAFPKGSIGHKMTNKKFKKWRKMVKSIYGRDMLEKLYIPIPKQEPND